MIKICHITSTPQNHIPRLLRECESALEMKLKPYIVAQGESFEKDGVYYIGVKMAKNRLHRMFFTSKKLFEEAIKIDADIYQLHDPVLLLLFALKLKRKGKIVIFDSHEFYGIQIELKEYIPKLVRKFIAKLYRCFESLICKKIDAVIAVCTVNGNDYFMNHTKKTIFVANLPDSDTFNNKSPIYDKELKTVVCVGFLSPSRGITHLIQAVAKTSAQLTLCGSFSSEEYFEELKSIPNFINVDFKGMVSRNNIIDILSKSDIGVSTLLNIGQYSQIDTLPTKVYEYMAMGLPVIISDYCFAKKVLFEYKFGIAVKPDDEDAIASAICYLMENPEIAIEMGKNGRRAVLEKYNWKIEERKLINLYEELIENNIRI